MANEHPFFPFFLLLCWTPGRGLCCTWPVVWATSAAGLPDRLVCVRDGDRLRPPPALLSLGLARAVSGLPVCLSVCLLRRPDTTAPGPSVKTLRNSSCWFSLSVRAPTCSPLLGKQGPAAALTLC